MATVAHAQSRLYVPGMLETNFMSYNTYAINASGDKVAYVFRVPEALDGLSITQVAYGLGTVTTPDTIDVRLETVSATDGLPTGTLATANANASVDITGLSNTFNWATLTAGHTATADEVLAIVVLNGSAPGDFLVRAPAALNGALQWRNVLTSYLCDGTTGTYSKVNVRLWNGGINASGTKVPIAGMAPFADGTALISSASWSTANDKRGMRFKLPFPFQVVGLELYTTSAVGNITVKVFDSDDSTVLVTQTIDIDQLAATFGSRGCAFSSPVSCAANTSYRVTIEPDGSNAINYYYWTAESNGDLDLASGGKEFYFTTATVASPTGSGSWTDTTTRRPMFSLIANAFDDGVGGGGGGIKLAGRGGLAG